MPRVKKDGPTDPSYPIDEKGKAVRTQTVTSLMNADTVNLITYRKPYDLSQQLERDALRSELERAAARIGLTPDDVVMTDGDGVVYLFYLVPADEAAQARHEKREPEGVPIVLPEGHVVPFILGVGMCDSVTTGQQFTYRRGLLPLHDLLADLKADGQ